MDDAETKVAMPRMEAKVLEAMVDTIDMIRAIFDLFFLFCIAFGVMFGIVFFPMFKHFIFG